MAGVYGVYKPVERLRPGPDFGLGVEFARLGSVEGRGRGVWREGGWMVEVGHEVSVGRARQQRWW